MQGGNCTLLIQGEQSHRLAPCGTAWGQRLLPLRGPLEHQHLASCSQSFQRIVWLSAPPHFPRFLALLSQYSSADSIYPGNAWHRCMEAQAGRQIPAPPHAAPHWLCSSTLLSVQFSATCEEQGSRHHCVNLLHRSKHLCICEMHPGPVLPREGFGQTPGCLAARMDGALGSLI